MVIYHLFMTNIAMEDMAHLYHENRLFTVLKNAWIFHGYVIHKRRVTWFHIHEDCISISDSQTKPNVGLMVLDVRPCRFHQSNLQNHKLPNPRIHQQGLSSRFNKKQNMKHIQALAITPTSPGLSGKPLAIAGHHHHHPRLNRPETSASGAGFPCSSRAFLWLAGG